MSNNNKMANLVYMSMLQAEDEDVAQTALELMRTIVKNGVGYQILGVAALLLTLLDRYGLNCVEYVDCNDINMAFLPFHHTFGSTGLLFFMSRGATNVFCDGLRHIQENFRIRRQK